MRNASQLSVTTVTPKLIDFLSGEEYTEIMTTFTEAQYEAAVEELTTLEDDYRHSRTWGNTLAATSSWNAADWAHVAVACRISQLTRKTNDMAAAMLDNMEEM